MKVLFLAVLLCGSFANADMEGYRRISEADRPLYVEALVAATSNEVVGVCKGFQSWIYTPEIELYLQENSSQPLLIAQVVGSDTIEQLIFVTDSTYKKVTKITYREMKTIAHRANTGDLVQPKFIEQTEVQVTKELNCGI